MSGDDLSGDANRPMTRRMYLTLNAMLEGAVNGVHVSIDTARKAVQKAAEEHPEWDMEEQKRWDEWERINYEP